MGDKTDDLGDRMKAYESAETERAFDPSLPLVVRLDGRAFSTFTRGLEKPFDAAFSHAMVRVAEHLVEKTHARIAYTQSDEITLIFARESDEAQLPFGGKPFKISSVFASMAASKFCMIAIDAWPDRTARIVPSFDCRAFSVPTRSEAVNALVWREMDADRNAVQAIAQSKFSAKALHGKGREDMLSMLAKIGVEPSQYPHGSRHGSYLARRTIWRELNPSEMDAIPEQHRPAGPIARSIVANLNCAPLRSLSHAEREAIVFPDPPHPAYRKEDGVRKPRISDER